MSRAQNIDRVLLLAKCDRDLAEWRDTCLAVLQEKGARASVRYWSDLIDVAWHKDAETLVPLALRDLVAHVGLLMVTRWFCEGDEGRTEGEGELS